MSDEIAAQRAIEPSRIEAFYHDLFVDTQVAHFREMLVPGRAAVADVGGGCDFFAARLRDALRLETRVIDLDPVSVERAKELGLDAELGNALQPQPHGDEAVACFNLILHPLVGAGDAETERLQRRALLAWERRGVLLFVSAYIYESYLQPGVSARMIYAITSSKLLSRLAGLVARFVPSLRANTFGVGVRFRSAAERKRIFESEDWRVIDFRRGEEEKVSIARRLLLIKSCRRDSFLLQSGES